MADRKEQLEKMLGREPNDPFLLYGLAMEHKKAGEMEKALELLLQVILVDPSYCYAYFQHGQIQMMRGQLEGARKIYERGLIAARKKGDDHAYSEIAGALAEVSQ